MKQLKIKPPIQICISSYLKENSTDGGGLRNFTWCDKENLKQSVSYIFRSDQYWWMFLYALDIQFFKVYKSSKMRFGQQAITKGPEYLKKLLEL